jgi:hypothetical protein
MFKTLAFSLAAFTMTVSAQAQSIPEGFYIRVNIQAEYLSDGSSDLSAGAVDIVLGYKASGASSLPVGIEVGVYQFNTDSISFDPIVTPVVFIDTQFGRLSAGAPRPALDDYILQSRYANSVYMDLVYAGVATSSFVDLTHKLLGLDSRGVRFDGTLGSVQYGISAHRIFGTDLFTAAANYTIGQFVVAGGIEMADIAPSNGYYGSIQGNFGQFTGSVSVVRPTGATANYTQVTGTYSPMANLTLEASHLMVSFGSSRITNGSVKYDLPSGTYVGANVVSRAGSSPIYGFFGGWDFSYGG